MNNVDSEYFRLLKLVLETGKVKQNRTGVPTRGVFGAQARFDLQEGFPLLTTKKVFFKGVVHELLWFLSGSTNIKYLVDNDVHIWDEWAYKKNVLDKSLSGINLKNFIIRLKEDDRFAEKYGELGYGTYGSVWRGFEVPVEVEPKNFPKESSYNYHIAIPLELSSDRRIQKQQKDSFRLVRPVDQISKLIEGLKNNPDSRRHIVSAWHPYWVDHCALPPCHCLFQFHTEELTYKERVSILWKFYGEKAAVKLIDCPVSLVEKQLEDNNIPKRRLNCQLYQRSADLFLGVPFNIVSYSLLIHMVAQVSNMVPGEFVHTFGDLHIYENHLEQVKEQLSREPRKLPEICLNKNIKNIFEFKYEDIQLHGYQSHPAIKAKVAV